VFSPVPAPKSIREEPLNNLGGKRNKFWNKWYAVSLQSANSFSDLSEKYIEGISSLNALRTSSSVFFILSIIFPFYLTDSFNNYLLSS